MRRGLTLLEMLIAMALTGVVAYLALQMFAGQQANYTRTREKVRLQDGAREAMRIIEEDVRNAGFRTSVSAEPSGLAGVVKLCNDYVLDQDSSALTSGNNATLAGDTLRLRYVEPDPATGQVTCPTGPGGSLREIGYRQKGDTLQRMLRTDTTSSPVWVDMLYGVVTFQVEYGLLSAPGDQLASNSQMTDPANWGGSAGLSPASSSGSLVLSGWTSSTAFSYYKNGIWLDPRYTYRIAFDMAMNAAMRNGANAIDSNVVARLPRFEVGFFTAGGSASSPLDTLYAYPQDGSLPGSFRHIELYVNPGTSGSRFLGFLTSFKPGASTPSSPAQSLTIQNASVLVTSRGQYFSWVDAPSPTQRKLVKAVRINLLAKAARDDHEGVRATFQGLDASGLEYTAPAADGAKSHVLYQRIIPVVNNGT